MSMSFGGWSILGVTAAVAIIAGIVLLIAYAAQRGLVHRELDGVVATETVPGTLPPSRQPGRGRTLGMAGAAILGIGLVLGLLTAITGWGQATDLSGSGPGGAPVDCAQSWSGCPQATPGP
jgi:hypothetical protein